MKKRIIAMLLAMGMSFAIAGCGEHKKIEEGTSSNTEADDTEEYQKITAAPTTQETTEATTEEKNSDADVKVTPTENATIKWTTYTTPEGYMTFDVPEGWQVEYYNIDIIGYQITAYDPDSPGRRFYFCTAVTSYPNYEEWQWWRQNTISTFGIDYGEYWYFSPEATVQSLFENSGDYFGYTDFNVIENLGDNGWGGDILQATCVMDGVNVEGIFTSGVLDLPIEVNPVLADGSLDLADGTVIMTAPEEEYTNWEGVLGRMFASLTFSDQYWDDRAAMQRQMRTTATYLSYQADAMSDMIMSSWEARNNTYDITSQQYSDATLGRERIYDTETGDIYYAENGWSDSYYGDRYQLVETGSPLYNEPVTGTISY